SAAGETLHGEMEAASAEEVAAKLQDQGHTPLQAAVAEGAGGGGHLSALFHRGPFNGDELAQFTLQLATLLGAGQPLDRALGTLLELTDGSRAASLVARVRDRVRGGELGGALEETLRHLAAYLERTQALRGAVINALIYPAFLLAGVLGSLVLLLAYVVPQFVPIFADMQVPVPWITAAVLALGNALKAWWWLLVLLLAGAAYWWRARLRDPAAKLAWHAWLLRRRGLGPLLLKIETARIAHTLGTLLKNGVPLLAAINAARKVTANRALDQALAVAHDQVKDGAGLAFALGQGK